MTRYTKLEGRRSIPSGSAGAGDGESLASASSAPVSVSVVAKPAAATGDGDGDGDGEEPMTKERLLKKAKLLKLKAKKAKTKESKRAFLKRAWDLEAESDRVEQAALAAQRTKSYNDRQAKREARRQSRIDERMAKTKCFACRGFGHAAKDCPQALDANSSRLDQLTGTMTGSDAVGICFRCGSTQHTLARCRRPATDHDHLPFATCFICSEKGHLSSKCPSNKGRGVYPDGGSCKLCQSVDHLARDCPLSLPRNAQPQDTHTLIATDDRMHGGADQDYLHSLASHAAPPTHQPQPAKPAKKVVSF